MTGKATAARAGIWQLGEASLLVVFGLQISDQDNDRALALAAALSKARLPGVTDIVPAYSSLLVQFEPLTLSEQHLRRALDDLLSHETSAVQGADSPPIEVPVVYGGEYGPDLTSLAQHRGLRENEVIRLHASRVYRVYFTGFMPGFAYMGPVPDEIAAPRHAVPRFRVDQGSVGVAGSQTGIYPVLSPGGWQIIGRTPLQTWDVNRDPPAFFTPGDRVRFVPIASADFERPPVQGDVPRAQHPVFAVRDAGGLVTVQDQGRPGLGRYGVPKGGAMDPGAAARANALVGNPPGEAVLESTWPGLELEALRTTVIALAGANLGCRVDGRDVPPGISWLVRAGQMVTFDHPAPTLPAICCYLAVSGGIEVPTVLGSRSTLLAAGFGGFEGRVLRAGDVLGTCDSGYVPGTLAGRIVGSAEANPAAPEIARIIRYEGPNAVSEEARAAFLGTEWRVSGHADRTGTRLEPVSGGPIESKAGEVTSFGVVRGAVQLPPGGLPVILNADHGTTGGYPLLGTVASVDWPLLAHATPGQTLRFREVSVHEARALRVQAAAGLDQEVNRLLRG